MILAASRLSVSRTSLATPSTRGLSVSALTLSDRQAKLGGAGGSRKVLPTRDWGTFTPPSKPASDTGRQPWASRGPRRDQPRQNQDQQGGQNQRDRRDRTPRTGGRWDNRESRGAGDRDRLPERSWGLRGSTASDPRSAPSRPGMFVRDSLPATTSKWMESRSESRRSSPRQMFGEALAPIDTFDGDDRHGRPRHGRESRSLLHVADGLALPPTHHHSTKDKKADKRKGSKNEEAVPRDRDRDRRAWVVDEDDEQAFAKFELQRIEREKKLKAAEKRRAAAEKRNQDKDVYIPPQISVAQLAAKLDVKIGRLQHRMMRLDMTEEQRRADYLLSADEASNLAIEYDMNPIIDSDKAFDIYPEPESDLSACPLRPPVVTIMGHVDHGKTTLLDSLRKTSVAAGEAGGITQHIGAFSVPLSSLVKGSATSEQNDATITFLDTPGHAAFTGMRARGASVTDLVVLVVAADDGVMPQTKEVIDLVHAAGDSVGLVVAINKCDKPMIDIERVKSALGAEGVLLEEEGGDVPSVRVSGLTGMGLDDLVETLSTLAEIRDLRARSDGKAEGWVLESNVDKGLGIVATVLVSRGTLRVGSSIVAGNTWARVRTMTDSTGAELEAAPPGTPVLVTGWKDVPSAGDQLLEAVSGEDEAKRCIANRERDAERRDLAADVQAINARRQEDRARAAIEAELLAQAKEAGANVTQALHAARKAAAAEGESGRRELRLVIKGDVSGTVEAVVGSLSPIGNKEAGVKIIHTGVGEVCESDIMLADAAEATVIGFSVDCPRSMLTLAASHNVPVLTDSVIYRLIEAVRTRTAALLPPKIEHRITGEAVVQQIFEIKLSRKEVSKIAGCKVANGIISKAEGVRVLRGPDREIVHEGTIETLKHMKKDVTEMRKGTECGIGLVGFQDIREGDEIVTFQRFEVPREL